MPDTGQILVYTNRKAARELFAQKGLTYASITKADIEMLLSFCQAECVLANTEGRTSAQLVMCQEYDTLWDANGLTEGYLRVDGDYFTGREAISFNRDGFIGFAGWADEYHIEPFLRAFLGWCEVLATRREGDVLVSRSQVLKLCDMALLGCSESARTSIERIRASIGALPPGGGKSGPVRVASAQPSKDTMAHQKGGPT